MGDGRIERNDSDTIVFAGQFRQIVVKSPQPLVFANLELHVALIPDTNPTRVQVSERPDDAKRTGANFMSSTPPSFRSRRGV